MFIWTDEAIQCVKDLWGKQSAGEIAGIIGHPSRSAVCGKANRLGLSRIHKQKARATPFRKPRVQRFREVKPLFEELRDNPPTVDDSKLAAELFAHPSELQGRTLMDLTLDTCRWPLWGDVISDQYCGSKPLDGCPYCGFHSRIAYRRRGQ